MACLRWPELDSSFIRFRFHFHHVLSQPRTSGPHLQLRGRQGQSLNGDDIPSQHASVPLLFILVSLEKQSLDYFLFQNDRSKACAKERLIARYEYDVSSRSPRIRQVVIRRRLRVEIPIGNASSRPKMGPKESVHKPIQHHELKHCRALP